MITLRPLLARAVLRPHAILVASAILASAACLSACGGPAASASSAPTLPAQVDPPTAPTEPTALHVAYLAQVQTRVLVNAGGYAVYIFAPDDRRSVTCTATCALTWPPLTVASARSRPMLGPGVDASLVGVDTSAADGHVVTYDGWPLYTYVSDVGPDIASGQGITLNGGAWYLMRPDGSPLVPNGRPQP